MKHLSLVFAITFALVTACDGSITATTLAISTEPTSSSTDVQATGFLFQPEGVTIEAGAAVTWTNDDKILHTITAGTPETPNDTFDREMDGQGTSPPSASTNPGGFTYFCSRHPHMRGVVHVTPRS